MTESRVALVTGASSGIGRAIALRFGSKGMRVGLVARRKDRLREAAAAIENGGGKALAIPGDVREPDLATAAVKAVVDAWGRLDVLVNNAGSGHYRPLGKVSEAPGGAGGGRRGDREGGGEGPRDPGGRAGAGPRDRGREGGRRRVGPARRAREQRGEWPLPAPREGVRGAGGGGGGSPRRSRRGGGRPSRSRGTCGSRTSRPRP